MPSRPEPQVRELKYIGGENEVNWDFLQKCVNRMSVSYYKYGSIHDNIRPTGPIDPIACLLQRVEEYERTGNLEFLCDAANFAMIGFTCPRESDFFEATDSDRSPGLTKADGSVTKSFTKENRE